jgi:hypothetical protein
VGVLLDEALPASQACASPGMFFQAGLDDDLSADFATLFQLAVSQTTPRSTR